MPEVQSAHRVRLGYVCLMKTARTRPMNLRLGCTTTYLAHFRSQRDTRLLRYVTNNGSVAILRACQGAPLARGETSASLRRHGTGRSAWHASYGLELGRDSGGGSCRRSLRVVRGLMTTGGSAPIARSAHVEGDYRGWCGVTGAQTARWFHLAARRAPGTTNRFHLTVSALLPASALGSGAPNWPRHRGIHTFV